MAVRPDGAPLTVEREYDTQLSHAIWELERAVRRGGASEAMRRTLVETHFQHIRYMEEIAEVPRHQRTMLQLQPRPGDTLLLLPGEGAGADELFGLADHFYRRGWAVMATNLAFRVLDVPGRSPIYWQTCVDEAANRYDVLAHYSTRIAVVGVGMAAVVALQLATMRRVSEIVALFPALDGDESWMARLRASIGKLLRREEHLPRTWPEQRRLAARSARATAASVGVPLYVVTEDRSDRSERGRAAQAAQKLVHRAATKVRALRPNEASSVRDLSPSILDEILNFLRRH
jgi:hypothetical protein